MLHAQVNKWHLAQGDTNRSCQTIRKKFPVPWPRSHRTGSFFSGPWKVWLSTNFSEPGKFPQWRSAAPLSARIAGPLRNPGLVMSDTMLERWQRRGRDGGQKRCFLMCVINTFEKHTLTLSHTHKRTWGCRLEVPEWKEGQLSMCLFWQEGVRVGGEVRWGWGVQRDTEMERWVKERDEEKERVFQTSFSSKTRFNWTYAREPD